MTTDTNPAAETAQDVLGTPPDLPTVPPPAAAADLAPAAPPATSADKDGNAWSAVFHENPPRLNAMGCWAKLRGNAARKAKGLPPTGSFATKAFRPVNINKLPEINSCNTPAQPAAPTASDPPPITMTSDPPPIHDGVPVLDPAAPQLRPFESYAGTAAGAVDGTFGVARLTMGPAWELHPTERRSLVDATQRVLHHYQAPILGPLLELVLILLPIVAKRRNDPETRSTMSALLAWWKRSGAPPPLVDPYRDTPAPGSSAPAATLPAVYRDTGTNRPAVSSGKTAWIP